MKGWTISKPSIPKTFWLQQRTMCLVGFSYQLSPQVAEEDTRNVYDLAVFQCFKISGLVNPKARFIFALKSTLPRWQVLNHVYLSGKKYDKRLDGAELSIGAIFSRVDFTMLESLRDFLLFFAESFNCISARKVLAGLMTSFLVLPKSREGKKKYCISMAK